MGPEISAKGGGLLKAVGLPAELRNNVEVLVTSNSACDLFQGS
jgi:hypothetical protein